MDEKHHPPRPPSTMPRGWKGDPQERANGVRQEPADPTFTEICSELSKRGDVLGVLGMLRSRTLELPTSAWDHLNLAVRNLEREDLPRLIEIGFSEIVGLTFLILLRAELHIEQEFARCSVYGGGPGEMPRDVLAGGWIERVERLSRFLMDVTATKARIDHLNHLNNERGQCKSGRQPSENGRTMAADPLKVAGCEAPSDNGRFRDQEGGFHFP